MTRKHFVALAKALKDSAPSIHSAERDKWWDCVHAIEDVCADTNPLFSRTRFVKACLGES